VFPRNAFAIVGTQSVRAFDSPKEIGEEFVERYTNFFNRKDIDHLEIRKALNDLAGESQAYVYTLTRKKNGPPN